MANKVQTVPPGDISQELNDSVLSVLSAEKMMGFEKAFLIAQAVERLQLLLTDEYMKPIMSLQGNRLGFKTDMDKTGGYPLPIVRQCLIEAVLMGVQPFGNQFNIIASNCYLTKEGFGHLLSNYKGLSYKIVPELPRIAPNATSAAIKMNITWTIEGVTNKETLDIPVKVNAHMGTDAVIGKANRKSRAWLYTTITGSEIADGDIVDTESRVVGTKMNNDQVETITEADLQLLLDMKKEVLTEEEVINGQRIIDNKEANSYSKLLKILQSK